MKKRKAGAMPFSLRRKYVCVGISACYVSAFALRSAQRKTNDGIFDRSGIQSRHSVVRMSTLKVETFFEQTLSEDTFRCHTSNRSDQKCATLAAQRQKGARATRAVTLQWLPLSTQLLFDYFRSFDNAHTLPHCRTHTRADSRTHTRQSFRSSHICTETRFSSSAISLVAAVVRSEKVRRDVHSRAAAHAHTQRRPHATGSTERSLPKF